MLHEWWPRIWQSQGTVPTGPTDVMSKSINLSCPWCHMMLPRCASPCTQASPGEDVADFVGQGLVWYPKPGWDSSNLDLWRVALKVVTPSHGSAPLDGRPWISSARNCQSTPPWKKIKKIQHMFKILRLANMDIPSTSTSLPQFLGILLRHQAWLDFWSWTATLEVEFPFHCGNGGIEEKVTLYHFRGTSIPST